MRARQSHGASGGGPGGTRIRPVPEGDRTGPAGLPEPELHRGSITTLAIRHNELGGILACYSTHHTPPELVPVVFAEFHRTLAPGGHLMPAGHVGDDEHLRPTQVYGGRPVSFGTHLQPPDRIVELLDRAGLVVTSHLLQGPAEGAKRTIATFLARKPEHPLTS